MSSAKQILEIVADTTSSGIDRGRVRYLHQNAAPGAERQFFEQQLEATGTEPVAVYSNPTRRPVHQGPAKPLDAADLAWLQRLPSDAAKVAPEDVSILVGLAAQAKHPSSEHRLISAILAPIELHHAQREAETAVTNLRRPLPRIPASVVGALAEAIRREMPQLSDDEALGRARQQATDAVAKRDATHEQRLLDARARLAEVAEQQGVPA